MIRTVFFCFVMLAVAIFEYGFIHALPLPFSMLPLGVTLAIYAIFCLRSQLGLSWMVFLGFVADLHAPTPVGEVFVATILGALVIYVVSQYVSHASWYAACLAIVCVLILWNLLRIGLGFLMGVSTDPLFVGWLWEMLFGVLLMTLWFSILPRLRTAWNSRVRFL